jgi:hypothetical protein
VVNHLLLPWHPLETPDAVDFLEKYLGYEGGIRRSEPQEAVSGGGGGLQENAT